MYKHSSGFGVIGVFVLVLAVGVIGFVGYNVYSSRHDSKPSSGSQPLATNGQTEEITDPRQLIDAIEKRLSSKFKTESKDLIIDKDGFETFPTASSDMSILTLTRTHSSAYYEADGGNFYVQPEKGAGLTVASPVNTVAADSPRAKLNQSAYNDILAVLKQASMQPLSGKYYTSSNVVTYKNKMLVCQTAANDRRSTPGSTSCSALDDIEAEATAMRPFAQALFAREPAKRNSGTLLVKNRFNKIEASATPGYQRARITVTVAGDSGGSVGLFYRKTSSDWQYFTSTQVQIECSRFTAVADLAAAFKGQECITPAGELGKV